MKTVFYNSRIAEFFTPMSGFKTITLFGFIFTEKSSLSTQTLYHEGVHQRQYLGMFVLGMILTLAMSLIFGFSWLWLILGVAFYYIWYILEWLIRLIQYRNADIAYYNIAFEREAYELQKDCLLPESERRKRRLFGWINYLRL